MKPGRSVGGVTRAGLFIKLDQTGADGFVPARTIGDDYFQYDEARHAMVGRRSGEIFRLGDRVTVKLVEAAPVAGALRFEVLSEGRYDHGQRGQRVPRRKERNEPGGPKNRRGRQQNRRQQRQR